MDISFDDAVKNAKLFLDPLDVIKKIGPKIGALRAKGISLYEREVQGSSTKHVDEIIKQ